MLLLRAITRGDEVGSFGIGMELACRRSPRCVHLRLCVQCTWRPCHHTDLHGCTLQIVDHEFIQNRPCNVALQQSQDWTYVSGTCQKNAWYNCAKRLAAVRHQSPGREICC
jgi:hypothetical protein